MQVKELVRTMLFIIGSVFNSGRRSKVLYYHDFHKETRYTPMSTSLELLKKHVAIIEEMNYTIVPKIYKEKCEICIMLDDGFRGILDCREFLLEKKIVPTICIAKNLVGQTGYLSEQEIRDLSLLGWNFISHTVSHESLNSMNSEEMKTELKESKEYLEKIVGHEVDAICAPKGRFNNIACENAQKLGYKVFYASTPGDYDDVITEYSFVKTRNLCQSLSPIQFKLAINGGYKTFQKPYLKRRYVEL